MPFEDGVIGKNLEGTVASCDCEGGEAYGGWWGPAGRGTFGRFKVVS